MKSKMIVLFLLVRVLAYGQADSTDIIVQKMMKEQKIAGLALAVIKNGKAVVNKGYGLANVELNVACNRKNRYPAWLCQQTIFCNSYS
jgi:CubicO group peptidase (beta-lactamase class C family)